VPVGLADALRVRPILLNRINAICPVQSCLQKHFASHPTQITPLIPAVLSHRGALANVINAGGDAVDAEALLDEQH
jgi:hypothetical protein